MIMDSHSGLSILSDPATLVSLAFGIVIVALNSIKSFAEPTLENGEDEFVAQLLPKYLATKEEYSRALLWYMVSMVGILCAMSVLGPRLFDALPAMAQFKQTAPLGFALILVGLLPNVPWLRDVEWRVRHFWHERAYIPAAARAAADTLRASNFDFSGYRSEAVLDSPLMRGIERTDFDAPRGSIEYGWARLSCLSYELERRRDAGETESLDSELLDCYKKGLDSITVKRRALENDIAQYRQEKAHSKFYENTQLRRDIADALRQLYILLACAVRLNADRRSDITATFRSFGFVLEPSAPPPGNQDLMIVGLAVMTGSLLALVFAALAIGSVLEATGIWQPSAYFPNNAVKPFIWAISALVVQGVAIITADWIRSRFLRRARWFAIVGQVRQPIVANYIRVGLGCVVTGYVALYVWNTIFHPATLELAKGIAAFALLPAATGAFYAYHLDNAELGRRPQRWEEMGLQSLVTALCGLAATPVWLALNGSAGNNIDFIGLVTLFGAVMGASLAWYLPKAAASHRYDPLAEARNARVAMLRAAALERFGTVKSAQQWLAQPDLALGSRAPEDVAADIELFPRALGLLQQEQLGAQAGSLDLIELKKGLQHSIQPSDQPLDNTNGAVPQVNSRTRDASVDVGRPL
jgi:hypothetical protein